LVIKEGEETSGRERGTRVTEESSRMKKEKRGYRGRVWGGSPGARMGGIVVAEGPSLTSSKVKEIKGREIDRGTVAHKKPSVWTKDNKLKQRVLKSWYRIGGEQVPPSQWEK